MNKEDHNARRQARANALHSHYASKKHDFYVDTAGPYHTRGEWNRVHTRRVPCCRRDGCRLKVALSNFCRGLSEHAAASGANRVVAALPALESAGFAGKVQGPHQPEDVAQSSDEGPFGDDRRFQLVALVSALMGRTDLASHAESFKGSALFMDPWPAAYANMNSTEWKRLAVLLECSHRALRELPAPAVACGRVVRSIAWDYNLLAKRAILQLEFQIVHQRRSRSLETQALPTLESAGFAGKGQGPHQPEDVEQSSDEETFGDDCRFLLVALVSAHMARTDLASHAESIKGRALFMDHWSAAYANMNSTEWKRLAVLFVGDGSCSHRTLRELPAPAYSCGRILPCTTWDYNLLPKQAILQGSALVMDHWPAAYANMNAAEWKRPVQQLVGDCSDIPCLPLKPTIPAVPYVRAVTSTDPDHNPAVRGSSAVSEWSLVCDRH
ncbi:uncharacterized protein LOC144115727 [Amblyomma americanum]